ncbi:MAG: DsbA family protein [Candidatus Aenigmarchaeota archaeon]|nr:DsbA family protein [Candidatus Aenigmarchaeota archaeon]
MAKKDTFTIRKSTLRTVSVVLFTLIIGIYLGSQFFVPKSSGVTTTTTTAVQQRASISVDDDPSLGDANAPITVVEFSDFQCPFCRASYRDVLPELKTNYVSTGKVKFVYRDFPLVQIHPAALPAAEAGECADEQKKFWEMHDKIFDEQNKQGQGTITFTKDNLKSWAAEIGLDAPKFNGCLDSEKYKSEVQKDLSDGQAAGVQGTPTFFVGNEKDGYIVIPGAVPYNAFKKVIDQELARLGKAQ